MVMWFVAEEPSDLASRCPARPDAHRLDLLRHRVPAAHPYALLPAIVAEPSAAIRRADWGTADLPRAPIPDLPIVASGRVVRPFPDIRGMEIMRLWSVSAVEAETLDADFSIVTAEDAELRSLVSLPDLVTL